MTPDGPTGAPARQQCEPERPWWGLGDVAVGIVAAQVLSVFVVSASCSRSTGWQSEDDAPSGPAALLQIPLWIGLAGAAGGRRERKGHGLVADFGFSMRALDAPVGLAVGVACQLVVLPLLYWPLLQALDISTDELSEPAGSLADRAEGTAGGSCSR